MLMALVACAAPERQDAVGDFRSRAVTRADGGVSVAVSVLSARESAELYGVPLAEKATQPVWVEVHNDDDRPYYLLFPGLDPNFVPSSEAAEAFAANQRPDAQRQLRERFAELAFRNPVPPGQTVSGMVLTSLEEGVKLVQIDLAADGRTRTFSVFTVVPGFRGDYQTSEVFKREIYPAEALRHVDDDEAFRAALEALPCCATNGDGSRNGDPLNLIIVGGLEDAFPALVRRGWRPTETKWSGAIMRVVTSALSGERYLNAPVSDLYLFGRPQDLALQKARDSVHQRNHLRLWLSPLRYQGKPVWVGQISRDIGSRMTIHSPTLTTHKIDPDVDEARTALAEDMAYSQSLAVVGYVGGVGLAPPQAPRQNLTTDPYYTDGDRLVMVFYQRPVSLSAIRRFSWHETHGQHEPDGRRGTGVGVGR
nr:LssY C-terminal domain-containing protein [Cupriavidus sp. D384]